MRRGFVFLIKRAIFKERAKVYQKVLSRDLPINRTFIRLVASVF